MLEILALLIGSFTTFLITLTVFAKNSRSITNRLFVALAVGLVGWSVTTYFSLHTTTDQQTLFWIRLIMFFVVIQNTSFFLLVSVFPAHRTEVFKKTKYKLAVVYSALTAIVALTPLLFSGFKDGAPVPGPGMALFLPHALIFAAGGLVFLFMRLAKATGVERIQLQYFLAGTLLMFTLVPIGNFIVPLVFKVHEFVIISPLYSIIFSALIAYAIVAKKMFDIKSAITRSVAYILSLGFIGIIYGGMIYIISSLLTNYLVSPSLEKLTYIAFALISATFFQPIKAFFDRQTKRVFYRDAYEPQQFMDELNSTVVENIELGIMLRHTTKVIQDNLKSQFCYVLIKATPTAQERMIGSGEFDLSEQDTSVMKEELVKTGMKTVMTDELGSEYKVLKDVLFRNNIAMLVRLLPGSDMSREAMYYLILGDKKSGNVYDRQDRRIIEIIADELLIAIQNSIRFEEIQQFNVTLQQRVSDATVKLQRTNKKLRDLDETKDEFISMASHQLRTPLTSVKGYMSMVIEGDAGKLTKQQEMLLNQAFVSSQRMVYLIADLLNVSRLKTGKFVIDAQPADLSEIVQGELDQLTETAKGKKIELKYDKPKKLQKLMLDETKVRQVVMNFIDNAIYYTRSGGHIKVSVKEDESHVYFTVKDDGIGVPKEDQKHLFNKFYRAGNARNARPDGTGLGLFMAKKVVDAQGGSILFESAENKGSMFGFCFDKKKLAAESPDHR
jgi:signal transduction histidine kinase